MLMEAIAWAQEEIRMKDMYIEKGQQLVRRIKMAELKLTMQSKTPPPKYKKGSTSVPKDKGLFARTKPYPN